MNDDLQLHLDGELPMDGVEEESRRDAEAWERLLDAFRAEMPQTPPLPWLETRVMAEIEALPEPGLLRRLAHWLWAPRPMRVSPLLLGFGTAAAVVALWVGRGAFPGSPAPGGGEDVVVYVQFALEAPSAQSVAVAGDFDEWTGAYALEDADGDGTWTGRVPLRPGVHAYMFLIDGSTWTTDPEAQRYTEDGFGNRNAILAVAAPSA
jgi:hypothetical protein